MSQDALLGIDKQKLSHLILPA